MTLLLPLLAVSQVSGTVPDEIREYFINARTYTNQNQLQPALEELDKATKWVEENEHTKGLISCFHNFALVHLKLSTNAETIFYWDRAGKFLNDVEYPYGEAVHKYIESVLLFREGNNFRALFLLQTAKNLNNDRNLLNNITLLEAKIYRAIEKFEDATTLFNSLVVNNDQYEQAYLQTQAYLGLANLSADQEDMEGAIKNALSSLELADQNGFALESYESNQMLSGLYEQMEEYNQSLVHTRAMLKYKDSLFTDKKLAGEITLADDLEKEHLKSELAKQDEQIVKLNESGRRSEITAILTSAFLTIISLLAVSLYRNNQIKLKTNDLLQTKNRELQAARDAAVQAMEAKTNFLSTVSHELRTPLYAVTGLTHLLLDENPSERQLEHLKSLKFSGDYLLNFINDILQINKIDADKLEPLTIEFSLKKVLADVVTSLQQSAKENNTELVLDYDETIPAQLMSDPLKLSQIFMNLVGNAIKFTRDGEVRIIAKMIKKLDEEASIYFEVKDNGIGIAQEKQENIFDSFEQGSIQINREYGGTGLGLTIVKSLLGLFESTIQLESELGEGSSFFFELNLKCKDDIVDDVSFEISSEEFDFEGLNLLVVEDNKINQVITRKMLNKKGISCDIANNGYEAVEMAGNTEYDGILMDIHMPGISGVEATTQIREFDSDTPIVALTAISLDDSLETFYAAGCNDVVTKPFKPEVFYQKIGENILQHKMGKSTT